MLFENGGHIKLSLDWDYSLLRRMNYVKRKSTTKVRTALTQEEFAAVKKQYQVPHSSPAHREPGYEATVAVAR